MSQGQDEYRSALPERGAVIRINLNPTQGREQMGEARPCLVLSHTQFNQARQGIVIVSPITSTIKPDVKTLVPIPDGYRITGSVVAEQVRTIDLSSRWWRDTGEVLGDRFVREVVAILNVIIG
ncbi:MAG: type II toxin-antitoxin system PemK/MazF family toxin [Oscillatoriales cyanobacterium]|nr:MAG: type II toxin-antitoxin system PemK/MazF family toxin [Oscillatoriales cyanobacterium]